MRLVIKLAFRGIVRDLRRSLITGSAITLGLALFIFADHLSQGTYDYLIRTGVSQQAGHLVLQRKGFDKDPDQRVYLSNGGVLATAPGIPTASGSDVKSCVACSLLRAVPSGSTISSVTF